MPAAFKSLLSVFIAAAVVPACAPHSASASPIITLQNRLTIPASAAANTPSNSTADFRASEIPDAFSGDEMLEGYLGNSSNAVSLPEPRNLILLGTGLLCIAGVARHRLIRR